MKKIERKWKFKDGIELEITGPFKNRTMTDDLVDTMLLAARFATPTFKGPFYKASLRREDKEQWPEKKVVFCETRKGLMGLVRLEVAKFRNPDLGKIINKLEGKSEHTFDEMLRQYMPTKLIQQQMMAQNSLMDQLLKQQKQAAQWQGAQIQVPLGAGLGKAGAISRQQQSIQQRVAALQAKAAAMQAKHDMMNHHLDALRYGMRQAVIPSGISQLLDDNTPKTEASPKKKKLTFDQIRKKVLGYWDDK